MYRYVHVYIICIVTTLGRTFGRGCIMNISFASFFQVHMHWATLWIPVFPEDVTLQIFHVQIIFQEQTLKRKTGIRFSIFYMLMATFPTSWPCRSLHGMVARNCLDVTKYQIVSFGNMRGPLLYFNPCNAYIYIHTKCIYIMYTDTWYILLMQLHIDKHAICNT